MQFNAEVAGRLGGAKSCQGLLYAPLPAPLNYRSTQYYRFDYEGSQPGLTAFVRRVLLDEVSQYLALDDRPVYQGEQFCLEIGIKPTVLDLEKQAILAFHQHSQSGDFQILELSIYKRLYIFGKAGEEASPDPFIRDIVNPAIHVWRVIPDARSSA